MKKIILNYNVPYNYIQHHLQHLKFNIFQFKLLNNLNKKYSFWSLNLDSIFFSFFLAFVFLLCVKILIKNIKYYNIPNKFQILFELIVNFISKNIIDICGKQDKFLFSLSFTLLTWIFLMNIVSFLPIDFFPILVKNLFNIDNIFIIPSGDINITLSLSFITMIMIFLYKIKKYGFLKLFKNFLFHPFNSKILVPFNIVLEFINLISKILSLSLRLFGNIYSGEVIFILISFIIPWWLQWLIIFPWSLLHIMVSFLQSFIFMILTLIYIS